MDKVVPGLTDPVTGQSYLLLFFWAFVGGLLIYAAIEYLIMPEIRKWRAEKEREAILKWKEYKKYRMHLLTAAQTIGKKRDAALELSRQDYLRCAFPAAICQPLYEQTAIDNTAILKAKTAMDVYMRENYGRER